MRHFGAIESSDPLTEVLSTVHAECDVVEADVLLIELFAVLRVPHDPDGVSAGGEAEHDRVPFVAIFAEQLDEAEDLAVPRYR